MYRLALRITLNSQEAEDVVQDVIIKLWKMNGRLKSDAPQVNSALRLSTSGAQVPLAPEAFAEERLQGKFHKVPEQAKNEVENRLRLNEVKNIEAYALRMTRNLALDRQRMKVNQSEDIDGIDIQSPTTIETTLEQDERIDNIRKAMATLPEKQRTAMQLRDFEGRTYKEIAEIMEISEDQVKVNIFRARQGVRERLKLVHS